jgi:hypothetical protein
MIISDFLSPFMQVEQFNLASTTNLARILHVKLSLGHPETAYKIPDIISFRSGVNFLKSSDFSNDGS